MNGSFYANVFVHYIPVDHDDVNDQDHHRGRFAKIGGHESDNHNDAEISHQKRLLNRRKEFEDEEEEAKNKAK